MTRSPRSEVGSAPRKSRSAAPGAGVSDEGSAHQAPRDLRTALSPKSAKLATRNSQLATHHFLMELQVEDMPARFLPGCRVGMKTAADEWLAGVGLDGVQVDVWATCRRLGISLRGLPEYLPEKQERLQGPRMRSLKDETGAYWPQVFSFAKAKGIEPEKLFLEETPKGLTLAYDRIIAPVKVVNKLEEELLVKILAMPFPKTMRWTISREKGSGVRGQGSATEFRFARPIRGLLALWDARTLRWWRAAGMPAVRTTKVSGKSMVIRSAGDYSTRLAKEGLRLKINSRKEALERQLERQASPCSAQSNHYEALSSEASDLVERPQVISGRFDEKYLQLPTEVLLAILEKSKLFGVVNASGGHSDANPAPAPKFLAVLEKPQSARAVRSARRGYERLVASRFFDTWFFWEQDLKIPLSDESRRQKLSGILWSKELGSVAQKSERVTTAAGVLAKTMKLNSNQHEPLGRAASLLRMDLTTLLVGEYPDLAGSAGSFYAERDPDQSSRRAAPVIRDASSDQPKTPEGTILALADRLDTLLAQFAIGRQPTAKEDPLGLKKTADSVIDMLWTDSVGLRQLPLNELLRTVGAGFPQELRNPQSDVSAYFKGRLAVKLEALNLSRDRIEAILAAVSFEALPVGEIHRAAQALKALEVDQFENLEKLAGLFKRVTNIIRQAKEMMIDFNVQVDESLFESPAEERLWKAILEESIQVRSRIAEGDYGGAFSRMASLALPLGHFFDDVMVMVDNEVLKKNRLALLNTVRQLILLVLDPSRLTLKKIVAPPSC
ncbi:MAG: glycine--tRNA ligase subunit beta [Elusimicrobia bacterium]|nr:glycine--tRNA ligase subunit beta [Elusimicrobiota bacterium]